MSKIWYLILATFIGSIYLIWIEIQYEPSFKPSHIVRYELHSDNGLWGRFEWEDINFFGKYTKTRVFTRDVYFIKTTNIIMSEVYSTPFKICVEGFFKNYTILKIYVDNDLIETINGNYFSSEWILSENIRRSNCQNSSRAPQRSNHHIGYTSNRYIIY